MYRIYRQINDNGNFTSSGDCLVIIAKDREGSLADKFPNRYLEGITLSGRKSAGYKPGFFSRAWGKSTFKEWNGQIEMKSNTKIYTYNGNIYIKGISKYCPNFKLGKNRKTVWELTSNGEINEIITKDHIEITSNWNPINKFKIKNK